jgi:hypothetical protein
MNAPTACFMFAHKTNGEHGSPLHEHRAISTKQISGVVVFTISDCLHERGAVTHRHLTILELRYIV